jgi:hypothetical protein
MVKEAAEISTDEESDGVVICPPDGNTRDCEEVVSGSDHDSSPEGQVTCVEPAIDRETGDDKLVNQDSLKLIDQEMSALPKSPTKPSMSGSEKSKRTVPQPFALSTQRRASSGGNGGVAHPSSNGEKSGQGSSASPASMIKKVCWRFLYALLHCIMMLLISCASSLDFIRPQFFNLIFGPNVHACFFAMER